MIFEQDRLTTGGYKHDMSVFVHDGWSDDMNILPNTLLTYVNNEFQVAPSQVRGRVDGRCWYATTISGTVKCEYAISRFNPIYWRR